MDRDRHNTGIVGFGGTANKANSIELQATMPRSVDSEASSEVTGSANDWPLGEPLTVKQVAKLIGCSAWTVRQKLLPIGVPCFRSGPGGRLTFYRNQVVAWILKTQKKGGTHL